MEMGSTKPSLPGIPAKVPSVGVRLVRPLEVGEVAILELQGVTPGKAPSTS